MAPKPGTKPAIMDVSNQVADGVCHRRYGILKPMLIPRGELAYDFGGAKFRPEVSADREFLGWVLRQFLYGEVTGIQCGHWLYQAPNLTAATFLAKQAGEELAHVRKILRMLTLLNVAPGPAHPAIKFLSTGMMGGSWGEHVTLEMALGEGLVLTAFYALQDTIDHPEIRKILDQAVTEEERHVEFGERETAAWCQAHPGDRRFLLGQALLQLTALRFLKRFVGKKLAENGGTTHSVLSQFDRYYDHVIWGFERRIDLLGLADRPVGAFSVGARAYILGSLPLRIVGRRLLGLLKRRVRLTDHYLQDPIVLHESRRGDPS